jgi:hypothetical protein
MRYQSNALWPAGVCSSKWGDNISTDTHDTELHAFHACRGLERHGFGGDGKVFPLLVWTSPVQQPPQLPEEYGPQSAVAAAFGCLAQTAQSY